MSRDRITAALIGGAVALFVRAFVVELRKQARLQGAAEFHVAQRKRAAARAGGQDLSWMDRIPETDPRTVNDGPSGSTSGTPTPPVS